MLSRRRLLTSSFLFFGVLVSVGFIWTHTGPHRHGRAATPDTLAGAPQTSVAELEVSSSSHSSASLAKPRHNSRARKGAATAGKRNLPAKGALQSFLKPWQDPVYPLHKVLNNESMTTPVYNRNFLQKSAPLNTAIHQLSGAVIIDRDSSEKRVVFGRPTLQCQHKTLTSSDASIVDISNIIGGNSTLHVPRNRSGYVLALTFREQQTKAADNFFSLLCWVKTLPAYVVEPYAIDSRLVLPINPTVTQSRPELLRFRDLFDLGVWQRVMAQHGFAPLIGWENFLADAPRELIVVRYKYTHSSVLENYRAKGIKAVHQAVNNDYKYGCSKKSKEFATKLDYLVSVYNFTIVRQVCINFEKGDQLTHSQFNGHIFGEHSPKHVTVLMEEWRGLNSGPSGKRIVVHDACWTESQVDSRLYTWPSQRLICEAQKYKVKYLKTNRYIALIVRTEKYLSNEGRDKNYKTMVQCLNKTIQVWESMKRETGIDLTFLSMDVGKYGSTSLTEKPRKYLPYLRLYEEFFRNVFGPSATIENWESEFESITDVRDTGYIGSLQKTLVSQAQCILFSGGGSFQKHARYMYETANPAAKAQCIKAVHTCA